MADTQVEIVHRKSMHRRRIAVSSASVAVALLLVLAWIVAWGIASKAPRGVSDLVSQGQILLGVAQLAIAGVLAITTLYYAMRTSESVDLSHAQSLDNADRELEALVDQLTGDIERTIALALVVTTVQPSGWRRRIDVGISMRRRMLETTLPQLGAALADCMGQLSALDRRRPNAKDLVNELRAALATLVEATANTGAPTSAIAALRNQLDALSRTVA